MNQAQQAESTDEVRKSSELPVRLPFSSIHSQRYPQCPCSLSKGIDMAFRHRAKAYPAGSPERLYTVHYLVDAGGLSGHHQYLYEHPNGLFILGLGKSFSCCVCIHKWSCIHACSLFLSHTICCIHP